MKNIGLITDISFWRIGKGENARVWELYVFLSKHSKLTIYYLGEDTCPIPGRLAFQNSEKKLQLTACLEKAKHDFVIVEKIRLAWILDLGLKNITLYLDTHDLLSERAISFQRFNREDSTVSFEEELACLRRFNKVIFLQKEEFRTALPFLGEDRLLLCPHPVVPKENFAIREEVQSISFFGGLSWPNIDGIQWFHDSVLPLLGDLAQKCIVHGAFVKTPFPVFLPQLTKGQVFFNLNNYYKNVDISINPVLYGSGLKIKTVEALAYGIPMVTTSIGAQGLKEESGLSFLVADTAEEFAVAIRRLASCLDLRHQLSSNARIFARQHLTPHACFSVLI